MRRLTLLLAVGTLWLFLAAIPAFADGGPHVKSLNNGSTSITADGCAGCHRAHTAQGGEALLVVPEEELCQSCHGPGALGATTNVWNGVQFDFGAKASDRNANTIIGALRNGGFVSAAIGTDKAYKYAYQANADGFAERARPKVPVNWGPDAANKVITGYAVTSSHLKVAGADGVTLQHTVWGNGALNSGVGATEADMECTSCHNPHGNGNYRILVPKPTVGTSANFVAPTTNALVTDADLPASNDTRNYTVIQTATKVNGVWTWPLLTLNAVKTGGYSNLQGDYMHRYVPWNATASGSYTTDGPNGLATFDDQITAWCVQCHTRYMSTDYSLDSGDSIYKYRHGVNGSRGNSCVTCHVGHGSNAAMTGDYSSQFPYPGGTPLSDSSRLLKVDNRGTCSVCHDPTTSLTAGQYYPPANVQSPLYP